MFRLPVTLLTLAFAFSAAQAGACPVKSSTSGGNKDAYPTTTASATASYTTVIASSTGTSSGSASIATSTSFNYGVDKVRGTNIGGWLRTFFDSASVCYPLKDFLVLESWITPSLFDATGNDDIVDEYTFGQLQDKSVAQAALQQHWDTWFTEQDFKDIAAAG